MGRDIVFQHSPCAYPMSYLTAPFCCHHMVIRFDSDMAAMVLHHYLRDLA